MSATTPALPSRVPRTPAQAAAILGATVVALAIVATSIASGGLASLLKRSGLQGTSPGEGAGTFASLLDTLSGNLVWIAGTSIALAIVVIGLMFLFGVTRASDYAFRIGAGVVIIILAPGIAA